MGIRFGVRQMIGSDTIDSLYCDHCDHYLGERHISCFKNEILVGYEGLNEKWNNCPYCGEPLDLEWM